MRVPSLRAKRGDGRFYYVTFHGWDPAHNAAARGVAKTRDFVTWLTSGAGLPGDAMFTAFDCNGWNISWAAGGCVGSGEGTILRSGDYMYQLLEAPDKTLGCLTDEGVQNWVLGLLRAPVFLPTKRWQQFAASEPTVVPAIKQGCYIQVCAGWALGMRALERLSVRQYHRLFQDDHGTVYLSFWADNQLQLFALRQGTPASLPIVAGPPPLLA